MWGIIGMSSVVILTLVDDMSAEENGEPGRCRNVSVCALFRHKPINGRVVKRKERV